MKTYICSDLHIGSENARYHEIIEFFDLAQRKADELIIVGDCLDLWLNSFENIVTQQPYKEAYDKMIETSNIVNLIIVPGNHDYNISKYLKDTNVTVKNRFSRDGIFYMHGWELDALQLAASPYYGYILTYFPYIYQRFYYKPAQEKLYGYSQVDLIRDLARGYAKKKNARYLIQGHTHHAFTDGVIFDCGCFGEHYVVIEDGVPELKSIQ